MGRKSLYEKESQGLRLYRDPDQVVQDTVGMSAMFLRRHLSIKSETRKWSPLQQKLFIIVLGRLKDWRLGGNDNIVTLNNHNVMQELGWEINKKNFRKVGDIMKDEFTDMVKNCSITLQDAKTKKWITENLLIGAEGDSQITKVTINPKFMNHFEDLFYLGTNFGQSFHAILEPDISAFTSKYAYLLFCDLRIRSQINDHPVTFTVKYSLDDLKRLLGVSEDSYTRINKETGKKIRFDYPAFEKKVLLTAIEEINCSEQIKILENEDGTFFKKEKADRRVNAYIFRVVVKDLDTIKNERLELQEAAKKAGLNVVFYPNLKEAFDVDPSWQGKWVEDKNNIIDAVKEDAESKNKKRNDKLSRDFADAFTVPEALKEDSRN